jgi:hypothetical protein
MVIKTNIRQTGEEGAEEPFATSEEAWIWYAQCQLARDEGARFTAGLGRVARPCHPDDIVREVRRLYGRRVLRAAHLRVLARFGGGAAAPESGGAGDGRLWREALDRLDAPLRAKGIVA